MKFNSNLSFNKPYFFLGVFTVVGIVFFINYVLPKKNSKLIKSEKKVYIEQPDALPTMSEAPTEIIVSTTKIVLPTNTPIPTATPKPTSTPIPTIIPSPTHFPNPPLFDITYPQELQYIEMRVGQTLCVVDVPAGGDHTNVQRKQNLNDQGWTQYTSPYTFCFDPKEGLNRFQLQYKNGYGDESYTYSRQFNFHRILDITLIYSGTLYKDFNCNGVKDSEESYLNASTTVNLWKMQDYELNGTYVTNSANGKYLFNRTIKDNESISLMVTVVTPAGYQLYPYYEPPTIVFSSSYKTATTDIPFVPNSYVYKCPSAYKIN